MPDRYRAMAASVPHLSPRFGLADRAGFGFGRVGDDRPDLVNHPTLERARSSRSEIDERVTAFDERGCLAERSLFGLDHDETIARARIC